MRPFLEALDRRALVCDGAMGTMLYARGVFLNRCFDELNLTQPDLVAEVHQAYVRAGADVIETNTFGANRVKLAHFGQADRARLINAQGVRIARHAARDQVYVAGSIGPLGIRIEPWGRTGVDEAEVFFREQVEALVEGGVDLFVLETFRDLSETGAAIRAVRSVCALPIVAQMTTEEDGNSLDGTPAEIFGPRLQELGADLVGLNCSVGPAAMLETIERLARVTSRPLSAQPNAGRPRDVEGRNIYLCSPDYMASYARRFILAGVKLVGGCCGTTPEHVRQIKMAVRSLAPPAARTAGTADSAGTTVVVEAQEAPPVPAAEKSRMAHALARGSRIVAVELWPPKGFCGEPIVEQARQLKIRGADVVTIPDGPRAAARMSALSLAVLVEQQAGIETILQYSCRDRSLLSMQSDLLGAHAMGLRNLLIVTGDPPPRGSYPDATAVFDVDSIGLTNVVARLNRGLDVGGQAIGRPTGFHVGVAVNPSALNLDEEIRRFEYKVEAGAEYVITHPIFDPGDLDRWLRRMAGLRLPVIAVVRPFETLRDAEFLANEVPGLRVPPALLDRMRRAGSPDAEAGEGIAIARELAVELRQIAQGLQVSTSAGSLDVALAVVDQLD